jgi:hypothetical protein
LTIDIGWPCPLVSVNVETFGIGQQAKAFAVRTSAEPLISAMSSDFVSSADHALIQQTEP